MAKKITETNKRIFDFKQKLHGRMTHRPFVSDFLRVKNDILFKTVQYAYLYSK